jgi:hypothetical protein
MWVRFTELFRFKPTPNVTTKYQPGWEGNVTHTVGEAAIAAGAAVAIKAPGSPRKAKNDGAESGA